MAELSPTMQSGLAYIRQHGGAIERRQGGFWVKPSEGDFRPGMDYVSPRTVYALETRGLVTITWHGRTARAALTQAGIDATNPAGVREDGAPAPTGPVAWEYRAWRDGCGGEPVGWGAWERVQPKGLQSMDDAVQEMLGYIRRGYRYELRSLFAGPVQGASGVRVLPASVPDGTGS